ncbi:tetratricopeptide repeat protein [Lutimonas zeaxanthinifaciens]|uniref:tetratricopeptide repeat protein n=1 Tax=Lutimonas zeaxanthinifaciens TaxID=3060215 RepID=UPI00265C91F8|nr:tetratricopeptide repeat protein [Lutimonas sp. YSD2104]WKK66159.1 tetratricopeptide repeat protein [Lutimonas sp. YSD2104]
MKLLKIILFLCLFSSIKGFTQESIIYTHDLVDFNHAMKLYESKDYVASQLIFEKIKTSFDEASELKARSYYYEAFCAIRLKQKNGDDLMNSFFEKFPTSTKRNNAFLEVGNYYFNNRSYAYALKWFNKINENSLTLYNQEEFNFKKAYALFAVGSFANSRKYFSRLLNSEKFGAQAKYYYGYMAYQEDDYDEADRYLNQVADDQNFDDDIPYYMANIKFKTGKFKEAIDAAKPLLEESNGIQRSELSKIVGESYFNLNEFDNAIPYLLEYEGKKGKWNNTDYYLLGYAYYQQKNYEEAMTWFTKIIDGNNAVSQNAYYHLGECYLKSDKKQEALNAFRNAKQMSFDEKIKKDAWLNYAKLSYEIGNPYKSVAEVIQEYLAAYPDDFDQSEVRDYLISAYLNANDYEGALNYLKNSTAKNNDEYHKVAFLYGTQLFKDQNYSEAIKNFDLAIETSENSVYKARSLFWRGEAYYRLKSYDQALNSFRRFGDMNEAKETKENSLLLYHLAYTFFQMKDYSQSGGHFNEFIGSSDNSELINDSYLRLGDCYFALSNYFKAIPPYEKVISANESDVDYAQLQIAFCYGYMGDTEKKINALNRFADTNLKSTLRDDAFYELGNSYVKMNKTDDALKAYDQVVEYYPMSSLVPKSLLKQGLVYFNNDQNDPALAKYKLVVNNYPGTEEAKEAVANAKQIYVQQGRVDEYEQFIRNVDFVNVSDEEIENTMFASAEQFYLSNNLEKSVESFQKYLDRFPAGSNALTAHFYQADALSRLNQDEKAIPHYQFILEKEKTPYTEKSLVKVVEFYLQKENWEEALKWLNRLEKEAENEPNIIFAQSNLMKGNYALKNFELAVEYAEKISARPKTDSKIISDAQVIIARSAFETGNLEKARDAFKQVEENATGELKAEAIYYDAFFKHEEGNYKLSNVSVQKLASDYSPYRYWGGKGLVIMAKNFYALEDAYQATYILESVIEKFSEFEDIVEASRSELMKIKEKEAKTNSSVIIEKE